jgi:BCD family chlorophyll transporter-like MFS transporter
MGAWTLSQAIANGVASVSGGYLHDLALAISGLETIAYAAVFFIEAIGLAITFALLKQLSIKKFQQENLPAATIWAEAG